MLLAAESAEDSHESAAVVKTEDDMDKDFPII